jgi:hypothetical protein
MLTCEHEKEPFGSPICSHLQACREPWISYVKWYVGDGLETELICKHCAETREAGSSTSAAAVCKECYEYAITEVGDLVAAGGKPEIRERTAPFEVEFRETSLPARLGTVIDIAPIECSARCWLLLAESGEISRLDTATGDCVTLAKSTVAAEADHQPWAGHVLKRHLHASADGRFAAVVNDYGRYGEVLDLASGAVTLALDGGDYHPETVPFSFAFTGTDGGDVVAIHRTSWNRLDMSDARTGRLLSKREPTSYRSGEKRPEHYLDYFHGGLHVSPSGAHIADDGWVWHPVGIVTTWSVDAWGANAWESEDGPTKRDVCARDYYWDHAMTWIDDKTIVVGGIGDDDMVMINGARVFDISLPGNPSDRWRSDWRWSRELPSFAGPAGLFFSDGNSLFSSDEAGLSRWDLSEGARSGLLTEFRATHQHRRSHELAQVVDGTLVCCRPTR